MEKKVILVTGAGKGIGFEIARQLDEQGHIVLLSARNEEQGKVALSKLSNTSKFIKLDVNNRQNIENAAAFIKENYKCLDVLVNNAAILLKEDHLFPETTDSIWQRTIETNGNAPLYLTRALLPLMKDGSRIINMSSNGGSMTEPIGGWSPAYCVSKSMVNAMTRHMSYYLEEKGISVNAVHPGWVKTDMGGMHAPRSIAQGADTIVWLVNEKNIPTGKFFYDRKIIPW